MKKVIIKSINKDDKMSFMSAKIITAVVIDEDNNEYKVLWEMSPAVKTRTGLMISRHQKHFERAWQYAQEGMSVILIEDEGSHSYYFTFD